ncbi:MAG: RCC1 repeat-containing protein, partial [Actinomycetota bacterium]
MSKWIHLGLAGLALGAATSMFLLVVAAGAEPLPGVEGVGVGGDHSCTVTVNSTVRCWGNNANGQLGDDSLIDRPSAVAARTASGDGIIGVKSVVSGRSHTCAVFVDGRLQCWGGNGSGQLGDGSTTARTTVVPVLDGVDPIVDDDVAAAGAFHTCALLAAGQVRCWGGNFFGQLGDGSTNNSSEPRVVVEADGSPLTGVKGLAAGAFHTCALMDGGGVRCWGANFYGQRGDGTTTGSSLPIPVVTATGSALSNAKDLGAGANHTCAVLTSGRVNCWGDNSTGQLGNGESDGSTTPVLVELVGGAQLSAVGQVSAGGRHSCAVITSGALRCWGSNRYGQLGDGTVLDTNQAVEVLAADGSDQLDDVDHVSAGADHTCVLLDDERVTCWGKNDDGQIADRIVAQAATPVVVPYELAEVKSVSLGQAHTCVQMISNRSSCWGDNGDGQLGDQTNIDRTLPVAVRQVGGDGDLVNLKQLVVGRSHSCALTTTGRARCWG